MRKTEPMLIRKPIRTVSQPTSLVIIFIACLLLIAPSAIQAQTLPNETPQKFEPTNDGFDYVRREVMIPMRDGVKLHTVVLVPKGARNAPILLSRTPYNASALTTHT